MKLSKTILAVLATGILSCGLFSQQAQATFITGNINFAGSVTFDGPLGTANAVTSFINTHVEAGGTGDFAGIAINTPVTMAASWTFDPSTPTPGLWSVAGFTFDLLSSVIVFQSPQGLIITGTGIVSGNGFNDTAMDWSFSSQKSGAGEFSFSANSLAVPDGGSAVALLGLALTGIEVLRRKLKRD
jgi:VPDSG-CTERM motif